MKIEENSIIQSLRDETKEVKQGALIYLLTESFSIFYHLDEMGNDQEKCEMLKEDLIELFTTSKEYCRKNGISWQECKQKVIENGHNKAFSEFIELLNL